MLRLFRFSDRNNKPPDSVKNEEYLDHLRANYSEKMLYIMNLITTVDICFLKYLAMVLWLVPPKRSTQNQSMHILV
jgi:hypothetical protein